MRLGFLNFSESIDDYLLILRIMDRYSVNLYKSVSPSDRSPVRVGYRVRKASVARSLPGVWKTAYGVIIITLYHTYLVSAPKWQAASSTPGGVAYSDQASSCSQ